MVDTRHNPNDVYVERKSNAGKVILIAAVVIAAVVGLLFATGFWSADVKEGALPEVSVKGGEMPDVDVKSKEVVVGTKETTVDVPTVDTEKKEIDVPVVGVKD
ncbi:hypothetical protein [Sphingobium phenoxybenzoativorans]|uniref:hypothetical protein n=1 Tax=Sphingobium phenoxybenzoativorans TaxID=1592790 RepID=UPI000872505B|nr:hypothetical protein [Sphingobium phenoxybenzoativorans]